jgi:hypothetical protein
MPVECLVLGDVIDDDGGTGLTDLVADRGFDLKLATGLEAELDIVLHCAGDPPFLGYPGDGGEAHTRSSTHDFKDRRNSVDPLNCLYIMAGVATRI